MLEGTNSGAFIFAKAGASLGTFDINELDGSLEEELDRFKMAAEPYLWKV